MEILIIDDHAVVRQGVKRVLEDAFSTVLCGEASSLRDALTKLRQKSWDVVILDISMPGGGGLDFLGSLDRSRPRPPVIVFSMHPETLYAVRALKEGAAGYVSKSTSPAELIKAIRKVVSGGKYVSSALAETLACALLNEDDRPLHEKLSGQEFRVMYAIAEGKSVSQIAQDMLLSVKTISTYRARILLKMNIKNNAEIARYAFEYDLLTFRVQVAGAPTRIASTLA